MTSLARSRSLYNSLTHIAADVVMISVHTLVVLTHQDTVTGYSQQQLFITAGFPSENYIFAQETSVHTPTLIFHKMGNNPFWSNFKLNLILYYTTNQRW